MSHFSLLVIGPDVEEQLAPYDENTEVEPYRKYADTKELEWLEKQYKDEHDGADPPGWQELATWLNDRWGDEEDRYFYEPEGGIYQMSTYNPKSKWDWWTVGGRWMGYFKLKQHAMDSASVAALGSPGTFGNEPTNDADIVTRGDVDAEAMREGRGEAAGALWDRAHEVFGDTPPAEPWESVLERNKEKGDDFDIDATRAEYHAQPRVKAAAEHDKKCRQEERWEDCLLGLMDGAVEEFQVTREEYVQRARDAAICPFAYLVEGKWHAPGEMHMFGMSTDDEGSRRHFQREFNEMFDALPDDTLLTLVDCHI